MTPRERARERTLVEIRALAWRHLETQGAAALSLRAIARELGVVSSAIYRYVPSRDDLLTDLIVEGYDSLAEAAVAGEARVDAAASPRERWLAVAEAILQWARERPAAWALLYGSPVPGYQAPAERTTDSGSRVIAQLARIVADAVAVEQWQPARAGSPTPEVLIPGLRAAAAEFGLDAEPDAVAATTLGWMMLLATVTSEVFEQLGEEPFGSTSSWTRYGLEVSADLAGLVR